MARYLAVDWDNAEVRFLLANLQRDQITVLKTGSSLLEAEENVAGQLIKHYGPTVKKLLKEAGVPRSKLLLGLGRSSIELINVAIPPAKKEEIPDLVQNQVLRDSPSFSEGQPLDFLVVPVLPGEMQRIFAATITRTQLKQYRSICQEFGQKPKKIEFRSFAIAELYRQSNIVSEEPVLLFQSTNDEADLVVLQGKEIVFTRSFKFPAVILPEERFSRMATEITRTLAVCQQELHGEELRKVLIFGDPEDFSPVRAKIIDPNIEIEIKNPFQLNCVRGSAVPESPGSFASLLGMILAEVPGVKPAIDFLHPREKPQPINIARYAALTIFLLAILGTAAYFWNKNELKKLEDQFAVLEQESQEQLKTYNAALPAFTFLSAANQWDSTQLIWLDEIRDLTARLPAEQDLVITRLQFSMGPNGYGIIDLTGRVRDWNVLRTIQQQFNDSFHRVQITDQRINPGGGGYPGNFSLRIQTARRFAQEYFLQHLPQDIQERSTLPPDFTRVTVSSHVAAPSNANTATPTEPLKQVFPESYKPKEKILPRQVFPETYLPIEKNFPKQVVPPTYVPLAEQVPAP